MGGVFISYASADSVFAQRLAGHIEQLGYAVWIDRRYLMVGGSTIGHISSVLEQAELMVVVLSSHTARSAWVVREWHAKYCEELSTGHEVILPVLLESCEIPPFLRVKRCADFRQGYEIGFAHLAVSLHHYHAQQRLSSSLLKAEAEASIEAAPAPLSSPALSSWYTQDMVKSPSRPNEISVELGIPYLGKITGMWKPDQEEQLAAWELYIEFATRVSVTGLNKDEGLLRESLTSLYSLFTITRNILRKHGPSIARPKNNGELSLGNVTINVLNYVLRPVLTTWHPLLLDYEQQRPASTSALAHERSWQHALELRHSLQEAQPILITYTNLLAQVADVPQITG